MRAAQRDAVTQQSQHSMEKIPVVALCGFLGLGKATLLRRWEMRSARQKKLLTGKMVEHFVTLG